MNLPPNFTILAKTDAFDGDDVVYTTLDSWLDTRLGTLGKIDTKLAVKALNSGYRERFVDEFPGISREEFKKAYEQRDIETLKMSVVTNVSILMRMFIKESLAIAVQQRHINRLNIDVNIWPYKFEDDLELVHTLMACIRTHVYENAVVRIISAHPSALTPEVAKENYQLMVMYDWREWLEMHKGYFEKRGIPSVSLIAPQLFVERPPTPEEQREFGTGPEGDVFAITERTMAPLLRLKFMPASLFSIIDEVEKENAATRVAEVMMQPEDLEKALKEVKPEASFKVEPHKPPVIDLGDDEEMQLL